MTSHSAMPATIMKRFLKTFCGLLLAANFLAYAVGNVRAASPEESTKAPRPDSEEGFVAMFNGKDLTGWAGADFAVEDGILVCHGHHGGFGGISGGRHQAG